MPPSLPTSSEIEPRATNSPITVTESGERWITAYSGPVLTAKDALYLSDRITTAFPAMTGEQVKILLGQMMDMGWTAQRASDAVDRVIRTCEFPAPTLARFLAFDRKKRLYTYDEMIKDVYDDPGLTTNDFKTGVIEGTRYWWKA